MKISIELSEKSARALYDSALDIQNTRIRNLVRNQLKDKISEVESKREARYIKLTTLRRRTVSKPLKGIVEII